MDYYLLTILAFTGTLLIFTAVSTLLLVFSSGKTTTEDNPQNLLKYRNRNKEVADKAVSSYLLLQEEYSDLKAIHEYEGHTAKHLPTPDMYIKRKRHTLKQREKIAV